MFLFFFGSVIGLGNAPRPGEGRFKTKRRLFKEWGKEKAASPGPSSKAPGVSAALGAGRGAALSSCGVNAGAHPKVGGPFWVLLYNSFQVGSSLFHQIAKVECIFPSLLENLDVFPLSKNFLKICFISFNFGKICIT